MRPPILVAGLDGRSLLLEASVLKREGHSVAERPSGRELLAGLADSGAPLVVLGPRLADLTLPELIRRIRADPRTRGVSILALVPAGEPAELDGLSARAGANAVLRRPLELARLETWLAKLLTVPRRAQARVPIQGHVVGTPRSGGAGHFVGLTRNISTNGVLLASPVPLPGAPDLELELTLPGLAALKALGRVVREAPEVGWPYLGYGVEFLYVGEESSQAISELVLRETSAAPPPAAGAAVSSIRVTVRREAWVYEILEPVRVGPTWQVEILRAPRDDWRPGLGGPFYVVADSSAEGALAQAREFVRRHG